MYTILVVCGSGIATSTAALMELESKLKAAGLDFELKQCDVFSVEANLKGVDIIASTCALSGEFAVPVVSVVPLLTGIGEEKVISQILEILQTK
jgi:Phosphotransferase system, galactitol-specific IIB component